MSSGSRSALHLSALALLLPLFGCGPGRNEFAPACPSPILKNALADLTRYAGPGPAHDITDLIVQARLTGVSGSCQPGDDKDHLAAKVRISVSIQRGPAMQGREVDVPVFLAITQGETVRDKQVFPVHVVFPPNVDRLSSTSKDIDLDLPVSKEMNGASYGIIAGFQLTPEELKANRQASGG